MKKNKKIQPTNKSNTKKQPIKYKENPKEVAARELSPEMIAQGLRKWLNS